MKEFLRTLKVLRWDDHRYYHQSRINQSLHFISAIGFLVAYAMLKRFNPQATLLTAGLVLLAYAQWAGISSILPAENSQGFWFFDLWEKFAMVTNSRLASTGLTLVAIAGVATYLNQIGASAALVKATSRPIMALKNPYLLLAIILYWLVFLSGVTWLKPGVGSVLPESPAAAAGFLGRQMEQ